MKTFTWPGNISNSLEDKLKIDQNNISIYNTRCLLNWRNKISMKNNFLADTIS